MTDKGYTIGIDCRFAATHSGIGRYTRELVLNLAKRDDPWRYVLFLLPKNSDHGLSSTQSNRIIHYPLSVIHYSVNEQIEFPKIIRKSKIDLLHVPHFNAPLRCPVPFITTIHDLILNHYPNQASFVKRVSYKILMKHAIRKSKHIITVSNSTADDIAKTYGDDVRSKISVTYEGVSKNFYPRPDEEIQSVREKYQLPERFLLYVGTCKEHKNVEVLVEACADNLDLVLVTDEIFRSHKTKMHILSNVEDTDLPAIYSSASCFILPSLYEGFGLPVLEAMACGCPVVASSRTSIPEIAGGNAILVEPSAEGISNGIAKALSLPPDRERAIKHAKGFSWGRMAEKTADIYKKVIS